MGSTPLVAALVAVPPTPNVDLPGGVAIAAQVAALDLAAPDVGPLGDLLQVEWVHAWRDATQVVHDEARGEVVTQVRDQGDAVDESGVLVESDPPVAERVASALPEKAARIRFGYSPGGAGNDRLAAGGVKRRSNGHAPKLNCATT